MAALGIVAIVIGYRFHIQDDFYGSYASVVIGVILMWLTYRIILGVGLSGEVS
jgi:hypothetical protein